MWRTVVRQTEKGSNEYKNHQLWKNQRFGYHLVIDAGDPANSGKATTNPNKLSNALSGNERNALFLSHKGNFENLSLVSGADNTHDGRSVGLLDYDQDGFMDIGLMSLSAPRFQLLRNEMSSLYPKNSSLSLRLIGKPPSSNRDAIGATVTVSYPNGSRLRLHKQAGQGLASQRSSALSIPRQEGNYPVSIRIRWPSGLLIDYSLSKLAERRSITIEENVEQPWLPQNKAPVRDN